MTATSSATAEPASPPASRLNPVVFVGSGAAVLAIAVWAMISPGSAAGAIGTLVGWTSEWFGWFYIALATAILVFVVVLAVSKYGHTRLGPEHSRPQFSTFSWAAMLFAAGIGTDLMFFSVAEPVTQYLSPPAGQGETVQAAREATVWTLFHYGISGWGMYALMGMALGYFSYRMNLPLSIRSALYPVFGRRIYGALGHGVDLAAVLGTIFGIATSLGIGVVQLNYGLTFLFGVPEGTAAQVGLIVVAVAMATVSAVSGIDRGIKLLSQLNVLLAIGLAAWVLVTGRTVFILNALVVNVGDFVSGFAGMTLETFAYDRPVDWLNAWTLFFWAWWIAWAPFVGLFLARISRGRTLREFIAATLIIPLLFTGLFLSVFGNSALFLVRDGNTGFGQTAMNHPEQGFYSLLEQYPGALFSAGLATFVGLLLYVTSADSGALVMGNLSADLPTPVTDATPWLRIFWAVATGLLTLAMLIVGGVHALTNATIIMGLPFSFVMFLIMAGLYLALRTERMRAQVLTTTLPSSLSGRTALQGPLGARNWRHRLARTMAFPGRRAATGFVDTVCRPAFQEIVQALREQGAEAELLEGVDEDTGLPHAGFRVPIGPSDEFIYRVWPVELLTPGFATRSVSTHDTYVRFEVQLAEGNQGYNVMGYTKEQLIADSLDQYERHLEFLRVRHEAAARSALPDYRPDALEAHLPEDPPADS
jgi:choline/glycine/proline betaine transport protein